jgi:hypothetical protein
MQMTASYFPEYNVSSLLIMMLLLTSGLLIAEPAKKALLIGVGEYRFSKDWSIESPQNNIALMRDILATKFEFPSSNVLSLIDKNATRQAIIDKFYSHLIEGTSENDIIVFYYSGHGSRVKDHSGDEDDDYDEAIMTHDSRSGDVFGISDDELNGLISILQQKRPNITVILDCCFSGTGLRGSGREHFVKKDKRDPPPAPSFAFSGRESGASGVKAAGLEYVLLSSATAAQPSSEKIVGDINYSTFTWHLCQELKRSGAGATYRDIMDRVQGQVTAHYRLQTPQLEGGELDHYVFADGKSLAMPYTLCGLVDGKIVLEVGKAHGVTPRSVYMVYPPGTKDFGRALSTGKIQIIKSGPFAAEAKLISGNNPAPFSRAVLTSHNYDDRYLLVYLKDVHNSSVLRSLQSELAEFQHIREVSRPKGYHLMLKVQNDSVFTFWGDNRRVGRPISIRKAAASQQLMNQLEQWAKWFNILSVDNKSSPRLIEFDLVTQVDGLTRSPFQQVKRAAGEIPEGERIICTITNTSGQDLYISVLDLSTDGSISVIYPYPSGASELLERDDSRTLRFETFLPGKESSIMDVLKVFATSEPVDFHALTQGAVRSGENLTRSIGLNNPLGDLLLQASRGLTRGEEPRSIDVGDWDTAYRVFRVVQ